MVTAAFGGPKISACSTTPSLAMTSTGRPRSCPNGSSRAGSGRSRMRPTATFSAAITAPADAAAIPVARPATLDSRRHVAIGSPVLAEHRPVAGRSVILGRCYSRVSSRHLTRKPRDDLVRKRAKQVSPLLRRRLTAIAWAEQHDLVASLRWLVAQLENDLVHIDRSRDLEPPTAQEYPALIGRVPRDALVVAERHQPERHVAIGDVPVRVGHAGVRRHALDLDQPYPQRHRRAQPAWRAAGQRR